MPLRHHNASSEDKHLNGRASKSTGTQQTPSSLPSIQRESMDISRLQPNQILSLQRSIGNQAVQDLISANREPVVQTKLQVGPAGDRYEQEADRVAQQVVNDPPSPAASVQRNSVAENGIQLKRSSNLLQRNWDGTYYDLEEDEDEGETSTKEGGTSSAQDGTFYDLEEDEQEAETSTEEGGTSSAQDTSYIGLDEEEDGEYEEDYTPSSKEIIKEIGLGKRLGWAVGLRGAKAGDWIMNRFRKQKKTPLFNRAGQGAVGTFIAARNRLYEKHNIKNMSRSERRAYNKKEREFKKRIRAQKEQEGSGMINF
jgi:hypothetical protein